MRLKKIDDRLWEVSRVTWGTVIFVAGLLTFIFYDGLKELINVWGEKEEYSYGYIVPLVTLFLIWQKKDVLERISFHGSWWGVVLILIGFVFFTVGKLSTFYHVMQYSFLLVLAGLLLAFMGSQAFKLIFVPFLLLFLMIPLPGFVFLKLSNQLQFISTELGVWFIRLFGISVFQEGNVIDLGSMKLQVVEACSGLRYLFPLMTLSFIAAYFFRAEFWKRVVLFISSVPITIFMNSFRIGAIGILVEFWGQSMAQGFLHDFEGWAIFMACTGILVAEMWLLIRIGPVKRTLRDIFSIDLPAPTPKDVEVNRRSLSKPYVAAIFIVVIAVTLSAILPQRVQSLPPRKDFSNFPLNVGAWQGKHELLEKMYLDILKLDDYILVDFVKSNNQHVNFYVAYYATQNKGSASHSPATCIPAGGWNMRELNEYVVKDVMVNGNPLIVNRVVITKGDYTQLVYYWFQERNRNITNDKLVSWYIFWDALTKNRTDGALIRLTTGINPGEDVAVADHRLADFLKNINTYLIYYIPN